MNASSFFFYDLETTSVNPRDGRIMQFAGQRTDMDLQPVGEPINILIKLSDEVVPDPDAIMVTGITPQQTLADGITEAEFLELFHADIATPGTIFVGYNTVRFDDEFMRFMLYRNFYDPYEWQYLDGKSRWDLLDVVRMTRALRPDGIEWPVTEEGQPTNRLELITKANGIEHEHAHDALSDVEGTISVARLIKEKQPKLFAYLLSVRDKKAVAELVQKGQPFLYSSGKYPGEFEKTTVVYPLASHPKRQAALVYDLRHDPTEFLECSVDELVALWRYNPDSEAKRLPVKTMQFNRCPAVAPLGTMDENASQRLQLTIDTITKHLGILQSAPEFRERLLAALEKMDQAQEKAQIQGEVESQLYDGFVGPADKQKLAPARHAAARAGEAPAFADVRLQMLLPRYKARNFKSTITDEERQAWELYRTEYLLGGGQQSRLAKYFNRLGELSTQNLGTDKQYILEELQLYGQSIMPEVE